MKWLPLIACLPIGFMVWCLHYDAPEPMATLWYVIGQAIFCVPIGYVVARVVVR